MGGLHRQRCWLEEGERGGKLPEEGMVDSKKGMKFLAGGLLPLALFFRLVAVACKTEYPFPWKRTFAHTQ